MFFQIFIAQHLTQMFACRVLSEFYDSRYLMSASMGKSALFRCSDKHWQTAYAERYQGFRRLNNKRDLLTPASPTINVILIPSCNVSHASVMESHAGPRPINVRLISGRKKLASERRSPTKRSTLTCL